MEPHQGIGFRVGSQPHQPRRQGEPHSTSFTDCRLGSDHSLGVSTATESCLWRFSKGSLERRQSYGGIIWPSRRSGH